MRKIQKKRRKRTKNYYFTQVHEDAIIKYTRTSDNKIRTKLYIDFIQPAFHEMVEKITYTYKFTTLPNIDPLKKNSSRNKKEISYEELIYESSHQDLVTDDETYLDLREQKEFWHSLLSEIDRWDAMDLKDNEKKVVEAVKVLLHNAEQIEIFNKKAVYLYLRELTGLNTKQVVNNLNKLRSKYKIFKINWDRGAYEKR